MSPRREAVPAGVGTDVDPDWEYAPLRIPPDVSRLSAAVQLSLHAEGGWELARTLRYVDGTRRVWLRRKRRPLPPGVEPEPVRLPRLFR